LSYATHMLAIVPAMIAARLLHVVCGSVRWFATVRAAELRTVTPAIATLLVAACAIAVAAWLAHSGRRRAIAGALLLLCAAVWVALPPAISATHTLEFTAIDVGQ